MKTLFASVFFLGALLAPPLSAAGAQPGFPLRVRGGPNLRCELQATKTPSLVKIIVIFAPSPQGAAAGLRPGQGSWNDRALRPGEPTRVEYFTHEEAAVWLQNHLRGAGNYYTFDCFNSNKGYLQATKGYTKSVRID